jgi:hypothetical protein
MTGRYKLRGMPYQFEPTGGPIDDPDHAIDLFRALGLAIAAWARMEHLVTALTIHINKRAASKALHDPVPSNAFRRKLTLLEKWITKHPPYQHLQACGDSAFFEHLAELAIKRNIIVHGHIESYDPVTMILLVRGINSAGKDTWKASTRSFSLTDLSAIAGASNAANNYFASIADELFEKADDGRAFTS